MSSLFYVLRVVNIEIEPYQEMSSFHFGLIIQSFTSVTFPIIIKGKLKCNLQFDVTLFTTNKSGRDVQRGPRHTAFSNSS